ncbi:HEAT repeat domain-containing protein [Gordonia sp. CPCC 205333]|uniref:HEAT repeat domain-containing protein n=1 Tax=Gordonia sp. CPCC 205333 TaxID=3140790 RepID=UPI003AF3586C
MDMNRRPRTDMIEALRASDASVRLRAALQIGTSADPALVSELVDRCALEPDFFVRDMLTWALSRLPADVTVPLLVSELTSPKSQARSQALHTLSKIADPRAWPSISALLHDPDDEVARSAWRAAVVLVPSGGEPALAKDLASELGRGDREMALSLSRALVGLGDCVVPILDFAARSHIPAVSAHAVATQQLWEDPERGFTLSAEFATRLAATGPGQ